MPSYGPFREPSRRSFLAAAGVGVALGAVAGAPAYASAGRTFYVAANGSDGDTGTSPDHAWATVERVNAEHLRPGDRVLFRRGDRWPGQLVITDSGATGAPIVVGAYGRGPRRPRIDATTPPDDLLAATVLVHNADHVHIRDLELTNNAPDQGMRNGLLVAVDAPTQPVYSDYVVQDLYIHDVSGRIVPGGDDGKRSGGIGFALDGTPEAVSRFADITITDNVVRHVDQTGLWLDSNLRSKELPPGTDVEYRGYTWDDVKFTGVEIAYNDISDTAKNGVIIRMAEGGSFHHNVVSETSDRVGAGNSVFTVSVYRFVVEWNEVYHNLSHETADGAGLDPDLDSPETVWRYNYTHDNNYGLMTLCTRPRDYGIEVYQNIDIGGKGRLLNLNYGFADVTFRRNAFWTRPVPDVEYPETHPEYVNPDRETAGGYPQLLWETHERSGTNFQAEQTYTYRDNVIYNQAPTATFYLNPNDDSSQRQTNRTCVNNTYYGRWPTDASGDPVADGFTYGGPRPPKDWLTRTVGKEVYAFWAPSIAGKPNPRVGPRR